MAGQIQETMDTQVGQDTTDPWAMAFAALDKEEQENPETTPVLGEVDDSGPGEANLRDTQGADAGPGTTENEVGDSTQPEDNHGGPGDLGGTPGGEDDDLDWDGTDLSPEEIESFRNDFTEDIKRRVIEDVAATYIKQGARHTNGRLGVTINHPDVCKRDRDGVPRFYNPETGREFTGDNPRRQAQEWVDDYNRELADAFNRTCAEYSQKLMREEGGRLAIIEFAPKYKTLDPVRRSMFDSIIEDYEVRDKDDRVVGYTCDLDKALAAVNRQVRVIQSRFSKAGTAQPTAPTGPALDQPTTTPAGGQGAKPQFKSIEEAMEWEQDQLLEKMRNKKGAR